MSIFNEPFAAEEFFVDEWGEREIVDGIFSVTGFRNIAGERRAVVRVLTRISTLIPAMEETQILLRARPDVPHGLALAEVGKIAH